MLPLSVLSLMSRQFSLAAYHLFVSIGHCARYWDYIKKNPNRVPTLIEFASWWGIISQFWDFFLSLQLSPVFPKPHVVFQSWQNPQTPRLQCLLQLSSRAHLQTGEETGLQSSLANRCCPLLQYAQKCYNSGSMQQILINFQIWQTYISSLTFHFIPLVITSPIPCP